jgi:hypothetical protein
VCQVIGVILKIKLYIYTHKYVQYYIYIYICLRLGVNENINIHSYICNIHRYMRIYLLKKKKNVLMKNITISKE